LGFQVEQGGEKQGVSEKRKAAFHLLLTLARRE
jgi:hypothetical protein